jgi:hypothetical protein
MAMYLLLFVNAMLLSAIAAYYSVVGLTAIFAAAAIPVAIMGGSLEVAKLVVASWLYRYWKLIPVLMRVYFTFALVLLMLITSMGIFGYLSKAHLDQAVPVGDVVAKVSILDEKIKTAKDNIDANRKALKQMDEAVDQVMGRSTDEKGADKAVALRRGQAKERTRLLSDIAAEQKVIAQLSEERAPIAAEVRKVEAEVGPIKYIAALIYGDNPDANTLERAVRGLIIVLIFVFDPLAVLMLIAANLTQLKNKKEEGNSPLSPSESLPATVIEPIPPQEKEAVNLEWQEQGPIEQEVEIPQPPEVQPILTEVIESKPDLELRKFEPMTGWMYTPIHETKVSEEVAEPVTEEITPELVDIPDVERPGDYITPPEEVEIEKPKRTRKPKEQTKQDTYKEENVSMDFNSEVDKMIESGNDSGLEGIYKKIVKELGKKNRAKTTHWGPIKSSPADKS